MSEGVCPNCKREYPPGWKVERERIRREAIRAGFAMAKANGDPVGRPRKANVNEVWYLREFHKLSISKIADILKVSRGAVQYALKTKADAGE